MKGFIYLRVGNTVHSVKPCWADFSDAGPGVGCNNFEVQFRDEEMAILHNSDYRIRLRSSHDNSSDNEAKRTNSAIGDSIVDVSTLAWNQYKRFDGLSDDETSKLTVKELEKYIKEHNLSFMGKKDKVKRIRSDFYINRSANTDPEDHDVSGSSEDETSVESTYIDKL
ncbi:Transient receptor potential cation channel subfamily A member 1 [Paramuricea clavata]|uniref:Transient receptor potential cation channel subfamily A member 1 n=1 Tax=Paramuricea clavata TaxID=317549 RepID=A0A6S7G591_PARCT|nr:Transient receptor potential cation channel subfamily A member 1 [Paramuricea clavata]